MANRHVTHLEIPIDLNVAKALMSAGTPHDSPIVGDDGINVQETRGVKRVSASSPRPGRALYVSLAPVLILAAIGVLLICNAGVSAVTTANAAPNYPTATLRPIVFTKTPTTQPTSIPHTATPTLTPILPRPAWLTLSCLHRIYALVQQEAGDMVDPRLDEEVQNRNVGGREAIKLEAWQIVNAMRTADGCTARGWVLERDMSINPIVASMADRVLTDPTIKMMPCQFVGSLSDIDRWKAAGYRTVIGYGPYVVPSVGLGVVGVNCNEVRK